MQATAPKLCRFCVCRTYDDGETGCPKGIHTTHSMEPLGDTGYWYCPAHDSHLNGEPDAAAA